MPGNTLLIHIIHKMGFCISEVPSTFTDRRAGKSKMSGDEMIRGLIAVLKVRYARI